MWVQLIKKTRNYVSCRANRPGCLFFIYGKKGARVDLSGKCYFEKTQKASCPEGFEVDSYDFYALNKGWPKIDNQVILSYMLSHQPTTIPCTLAECDAKKGPQRGACPEVKCPTLPEGCSYVKKYESNVDRNCCPIFCHAEDAKGNKCGPGMHGHRN